MSRTVLVTGGTIRLGLAISRRLAAGGWNVLATSHRRQAGADFLCDFAVPGAAEELFGEAVRRLGGRAPDAIVNNAGIFSGAPEEIFRVNRDAPARLTKLLAEAAASGATAAAAVVNIVDCRVLSRPPATAYEESKKALLDATVSDARSYAGLVRVNAVAPGPALASALVKEKAGPVPFGRPAPEDVARAVEFLLEARSTSACIIPVDGGQSVHGGAG